MRASSELSEMGEMGEERGWGGWCSEREETSSSRRESGTSVSSLGVREGRRGRERERTYGQRDGWKTTEEMR